MCYRFAYGDVEHVTAKYKVQLSSEALSRLGDPLNVFPSDYAPIIFNSKEAKLIADTMKWGLVPFWAKDQKIGLKLFNARVETIAEKPSFRSSVEHYRCLVPVETFNESMQVDKAKKQFVFSNPKSESFSLVGLFSEWTNPDTKTVLKTFTVITMPAGQSVKLVHDRMPD